MNPGWQFDGQGYGLLIFQIFDFKLRHVSSPVRLEDQIAIDDDPDWKSRPDRERGLNIKVASNHLLSSLIQRIGGS